MAPSCAPPGIGDTKPFFIAAAGLSDTANLSGSQQPFGRIADKVAGSFLQFKRQFLAVFVKSGDS